jgi:hypothetical protein
MKIKFILSLVTFPFLLTSCFNFTGSKRNVLFETEPPGAKVFVNGFEKGTTSSNKVKADDRVDFKLDNC